MSAVTRILVAIKHGGPYLSEQPPLRTQTESLLNGEQSRRAALILAFVAVLMMPSCTQPSNTTSSETYAKRGEPKEVQPVTFNGVKYSAPQCWLQVKESLGPGYIQANDLKTGKVLWQLRVYEIRINENIERDVQDVFITSLKIVDGKLHVWNEAHDHFVVDLARRRVIEGAKRVYYYR